MTDQRTASRSDAVKNRERILEAARAAFAEAGAETSMAEVARRAGIGSATLYRNFATRRDLLETHLVDEIDEVCESAATIEGENPADRLTNWLRRFFQYVSTKRPVVIALVEDTDRTNPVFDTRGRMILAAQPLFTAAQNDGDIAEELTLDQVLDLVTAVAKITGGDDYRRPLLDAALAGLQASGATGTRRRTS